MTHFFIRISSFSGIFLLVLLSSPIAFAKPWASELFCKAFPESPSCSGANISCSFCHQGQPPELNSFGHCYQNSLRDKGEPLPSDKDNLRRQIEAIGSQDCDDDGFTNLREIELGSLPGSLQSAPPPSICEKKGRGSKSCTPDPDYVYKKIWLDVCGEPPSYDDFLKFKKLKSGAKEEAIADQLDSCMESHHWRGKDGVVWEIGHYKIRPVGSVKAGEDAGVLPIVDYYADFNLFVYSQIDGHDAREMLLADYTVTRSVSGDDRTVYTKVAPQRLLDGQVMQPERRVGLLTTFWNLSFYLNYTGIARVLVAQAFNAFLGLSLAEMQGLNPPDPEESGFKDYDSKGVTRPECAQCHQTIDPLSYPFRNYNGLTGTTRVLQGQSATPLQNLANLGDEKSLIPLSYALPRMEFLNDQYPGIKEMPEAGYIMGQRVENLREWAEVLVNSDQFAANTVKDYWRVMIGHNPQGNENIEFEALWKKFRTEHGYSVKALLHDLIKTEAYSVP